MKLPVAMLYLRSILSQSVYTPNRGLYIWPLMLPIRVSDFGLITLQINLVSTSVRGFVTAKIITAVVRITDAVI